MENKIEVLPENIWIKFTNQIIKKISDFYSIDINNLILQNHRSFKLEDNDNEYWFFVEDEKTKNHYWISAIYFADTDELIKLECTEL